MQVSLGKNPKKRPKSQRGLGKPTGFEEYNTDGPLTPAEHDEMCKLYSPTRPFIDRFEDALMRFQYKRRILPERLNIFHKYLQYGGVSIGPNYGTGVTAKEVKGMPEEEAMQARTQTSVHKSREELEISFTEVVKGYLGAFHVSHFNPETRSDVELATVTIRNFYTYLLFHEVCPEYKQDLEEARKICDIATGELWKNLQLVHDAPGPFNQSCSKLFGGYHFGSSEWQVYQESEETSSDKDHAYQVARKVVKYAIAGAGSNQQASRFQQMANQDMISTLKLEDIDGFEVLEVIQPDDATRDFYNATAPDLIPVGKIRAKSYRDPANPDIDMYPEERAEWEKGNGPSYDLEFFLEPNLLAFCYPGLKVITSVWEINCGVYYFDEIMSTLPTFYTVLANDLMLHWKFPKEIAAKDKRLDSIEESAEESVKQYLKASGTKFSDDTTPVLGISGEDLEEFKTVTDFENMTVTGPPDTEVPESTREMEGDLENDKKLDPVD